MHKNMRRSLMTLYLQETWNEEYSLAIKKYLNSLSFRDKIELQERREHQRIAYNTRQGWRKDDLSNMQR